LAKLKLGFWFQSLDWKFDPFSPQRFSKGLEELSLWQLYTKFMRTTVSDGKVIICHIQKEF
jgi:hypothetical protein